MKHRDYSFNIVDVPGLIEGASEGKGLGNDFLRHILKAAIFCFVIDVSRYEQGIEEFDKLFDEITRYMENVFLASRDFGGPIESVHFALRKGEGSKLFLQVQAKINGEEKTLMEKLVMIVLNKQDIIEDAEVIAEYKKHFLQQAQSYLQKTFKVKLTDKETPVFLMSAMTKDGVNDWLDEIQNYLQYERQHTSMLLFDIVPISAKPK